MARGLSANYLWAALVALLLGACAETSPSGDGADADVGVDGAEDPIPDDPAPDDGAADAADEDRGADVLDAARDPELDAADSSPDGDTSDALDADAEPDAGGENCTNGADDDGDSRIDCYDPDCFDTAPCEGVNPAPFAEPRLWRRTWSDEFNGPEPGREDCYDNAVTPPQCLTLYWQVEPCPESALANLANLDKCSWSTFLLYNWMDNGQPIGEGVDAFDPGLVSVSGGELVLTSVPSLPPGGIPGDWSISQVMTQYDCGVPPAEGYAWSMDCPILSGAVWSRAMGPVSGLLQTYGRFEIRARLPVGKGSWPAHWMLPQDGPWPGDGEIDIMEAVNWLPDEVAANFHDGVDIETESGTIHTHMSAGSMSYPLESGQQSGEYHVFSVDWDAEALRFYVDSQPMGTVREGTLLPNTDLATGDDVGDYPVDVPDEDFYMILNSTVAAFGANNYPDPRNFPAQVHRIDYVRAWAECEDPAAEACPAGGAWDGANCLVGALPDRDDVFRWEGDLVYPAEGGAEGCPDGGERQGDLCVVYDTPGTVYAFTYADNFYLQSSCLAATLSDSPRCYYPCGGLGEYRNGRCWLGAPPEGQRGMIVSGRFAYQVIQSGGERCPIGRDRGTYCEVGAVPAGRTPFIPFDGDAFYINAVCDPAEFMPNCTQPCPEGTEYMGDGCYVASPPPGHSPFVWEGGFYYDWLDTAEYAARCPVGVDDSAHCYVGPAPGGLTPHIRDGAYWVDAACGNVPVLE